MHFSRLANHPLLKWAKWAAWTKWLMQLACPECAYLDLHHHHRAQHHHCHQHPNHHLPVGPQSDVQAPHRVGGASCWPPFFHFAGAFSGSCWLQAASPIIHPHQHTRVPSPAPPKFLTIHTHRLTHTHTHSRSVTLTLNTIT